VNQRQLTALTNPLNMFDMKAIAARRATILLRDGELLCIILAVDR
jgi:hypothetical protein